MRKLFVLLLLGSAAFATDPDFTMAAITDPQFIHNSCPAAAINLANALVALKGPPWNLQLVLGLGDIVNMNSSQLAGDLAAQSNAVTVFGIFDANGVKWITCGGNHDRYPQYGDPSVATRPPLGDFMLSSGFFSSAYRSTHYSYWAGSLDSTSGENTAIDVHIGTHKFLIVALEIWPGNTALNWGTQMHNSYLGHSVIVTTHVWLPNSGTILNGSAANPPIANNPTAAWNNWLGSWPNLLMVLNGHEIGGPFYNHLASLSFARNGRTVHQWFSNWQDLDRSDAGNTHLNWCGSGANTPDGVSDAAHVVLLKFRPAAGVIEYYALSTNNGLWVNDSADSAMSATPVLLYSVPYQPVEPSLFLSGYPNR